MRRHVDEPTVVEDQQLEPPRVCRRLFRLSQVASAAGHDVGIGQDDQRVKAHLDFNDVCTTQQLGNSIKAGIDPGLNFLAWEWMR